MPTLGRIIFLLRFHNTRESTGGTVQSWPYNHDATHETATIHSPPNTGKYEESHERKHHASTQ